MIKWLFIIGFRVRPVAAGALYVFSLAFSLL